MITKRLRETMRLLAIARERRVLAARVRLTHCSPEIARLFTDAPTPDADDAPFIVVLESSSNGALRRLLTWLLTRVRARAAERAIVRAGGIPAGRYGLFPSAAKPVVSYQLHSAASAYAESRLLSLRAGHPFVARVRALVSRLVGCDPSIGAFVVVGRRSSAVGRR
jgi:hypothetical protein